MSLDENFVASFLVEQNFLGAVEAGIKLEHLLEALPVKVWKFSEEFFNTYRSTPSIELVEGKYGGLPRPLEPLTYWVKQLTERQLFSEIEETYVAVRGKLDVDDATGAYGEMREFVKTKEQTLLSKSSISPIVTLKEPVWGKYLEAKAGKMGIVTPWPTVNDWTRGFYPKDMSFLIGRSGFGKSWVAIACADAAVFGIPVFDEKGDVISGVGVETLFISCEMTKEDIAARHFAMKMKKPYAEFRRGGLSPSDEEDFKLQLDLYQTQVSFEIMDGSQGLSIVDIERAFEKTKAKLVVIDSCYRIRARQKTSNRFDNMSFVADDLKLFAQSYGKAVVATTQVNREGGKKRQVDGNIGMGQEDVALSDVINWNSTNVIGLQRTDENKTNSTLTLWPIKIRENENSGTSATIHWNFSRMDFSEVGREDFVTTEIPRHFQY